MLSYQCDVCRKAMELSDNGAKLVVYRRNSLKVNEFHVCLACWDKVKPAELVEVII